MENESNLRISENFLVSDVRRPIYILTFADRLNPDYNQPTPAQLDDMAGSVHLPTSKTNFKVVSVVLHVKNLSNSAVCGSLPVSFRQLSTHRQDQWSRAQERGKRQKRTQDERRGLFHLRFAPLQL